MILDFGCGDGRSWDANDDVVGIDINLHRLEVAKEKISVVQCDGRFLPFRSSVFSLLLSDSVLEHISDYRRALAEIGRVLTVGGACRIWQPVDNDPIFFVARRVAGTWNGDKIYSKFFSGYLIRQMAESFKIISVGYLPNSPTVGILGFFNRKTPRALSTLDRFYKIFCQTTGIFHWEVVIEASRVNFSDHLGHQQISVRGIPRITNNLRDPLPLPSIRGQFRNEDASLPLKVRYRRLLEAVV